MNKLTMFTLFELFIIRYDRKYSLSTINSVRDFLITRIKRTELSDDLSIDLLNFLTHVHLDSLSLSTDEFLCVKDFISYIKSVDKNI